MLHYTTLTLQWSSVMSSVSMNETESDVKASEMIKTETVDDEEVAGKTEAKLGEELKREREETLEEASAVTELGIKEEMNVGGEEDQNEIKMDKGKELYDYVENNGFTSEKYKIEIRNLPKYYGIYELKKLLNEKLSLNTNKVKSPRRMSPWVYVCFRSEEDRSKAIEALQNYKWKGSVLEVKIADPAPDPLKKRRLEHAQDESQVKRMKIETKDQQEDAIKSSTMPLWNVPYEEQLRQKAVDAENLLRKLGSELVLTNKELKGWINEQKAKNNGLPCKLLDIRALPEVRDYYRNKCEFTIGKNGLTGERTVGFRLGTYASGSISVAPVDSLRVFSQKMMPAVKAVEKFVQESKYEVFCPETLTGHWKQLTVRVGIQTGQVMLIIGFSSKGLENTDVGGLKSQLKEYLMGLDSSAMTLSSVYFHLMNRKERGERAASPELLLGEPYIEEIMCGLTFKISPQSFFQVNTKCMEKLLESVKELADLNDETTVLDVCCGTGVIGLTLSKDCKEVLGLELNREAVEDAKANAKKNNIENCQFFCGDAQHILNSVVSRAMGNKVVAILDPPRAGLHQKAINLVRKTKNLERIIFLSCDAKSAFKNFTELGRAPSKTLHGLPFVPIAAVPVDLFPHTNHYELVIYFERIDIAETRQTQSNDNQNS